MTQQQQQQRQQQTSPKQQYVARTRQDLINSGELFRAGAEAGAGAEKFAHEESRRRPRAPPSSGQASECCYSVCNLALLVAAVISMLLLVRFFQDEPLYEFGEYLLSLGFYRQLMFVLALMPLLLLLPIWNVLSALMFSRSAGGGDGGGVQRSDHSAPSSIQNHAKQPQQPPQSQQPKGLLKLRLVVQFALFALTLLGLVFVAPYVSRASVASQVDFELKRNQMLRSESVFHQRLLDEIQEAYECCDHLWYRANLADYVPYSCLQPGGLNFEFRTQVPYPETCAQVLGSMVSTRCAIIAACLFLILVTLGCLFAIDCERLFGSSRANYELANGGGVGGGGEYAKDARHLNELARTGEIFRPHEDSDRESISSMARLRELEERERQVPLLAAAAAAAAATAAAAHQHQQQRRQSLETDLSDSLDLEQQQQQQQQQNLELQELPEQQTSERESTQSRRARFLQDQQQQQQREPGRQQTARRLDSPVVLTRADYKTIARDRSQSPVFLATTTVGGGGGASNKPVTRMPIKSALKSSSQQNLNEEEEEEQQQQQWQQPEGQNHLSSRRFHDDDEDDESLVADYAERLRKSDSLLRQKQLLRREQLRKSLQSVRFADDP